MLKFHMSLNVANLERSIGFYRILFGMEPAKCHDDYAKFELTEPPVVFSLVPQPSLTGGSLGKIGLRLADIDAVLAVRQRVQAAGLATQCPCGGGNSKFYVADPDLNFWQVYCGDDTGPMPTPPGNDRAAPPSSAGPVIWEHYITNPFPERIPHADGSVDEVRLTGAFNANLRDDQLALLLQEARRVLRAGGKLVVHGLAGDKPLAGGQPRLPGLAALVSQVPTHTEPIAALLAAGFMGIQFVKLTEQPWFNINGVELREFKLLALQPAVSCSGARPITYRGPFHEARDDAGNVFRRGERMLIADTAIEVLQRGAAAEQFALSKAEACAAPGSP